MIQLTHLKLQQVMSRMVPDGVYLDADGLAEVDLGNGTNYNPQEALNMFFQTGSVIGRSFTSEGDMNPGKVPIQEITSGSGGNKIGMVNNNSYQLMGTAGGSSQGTTDNGTLLSGTNRFALAYKLNDTAISINGNEVTECGIQKNLKIVDLTGAGDLFDSGYLHGNLNNFSQKV